jgi:hypothetical protein
LQAGWDADDLLDHPIGEVFLLWIAAHIGERQHRYRRLVGERQNRCSVDRRRCWRVFRRSETDPINTHRSSNVFEALFAQIIKCEVEPPAASSWTRAETQIPPESAKPSSRAATFTPSPKMSPSSTTISPTLMPIRNSNAFLSGNPSITLGHCVLNFSRTPQGIDDTGELDQQAITGRFDDAATVFSDLRVDNVRPDRPYSVEGSLLIRPHKPGITGHISGEDCR